MSITMSRACVDRFCRPSFAAASVAALGFLCGCESWDGSKNMVRREALQQALEDQRWNDAEATARDIKRSVLNSGPMIEQAIFQAYLDAGQYDRAAAHADAAYAALANDREAMDYLARQIAGSPAAMANAKLRAFGQRCAERGEVL